MNGENIEHIYYKISTVKKIELMNFAGKWMDLEKIILSLITQTQKERQWWFSLRESS